VHQVSTPNKKKKKEKVKLLGKRGRLKTGQFLREKKQRGGDEGGRGGGGR